MDDDQVDSNGGAGPARFIGAVFGLVFLGIGLTVIGFLWGSPFGAFGSPPLVFRIFGTFIAIPFVAIGGGTAYAALTGKLQQSAPGRLSVRRRRTMNSDGAQPQPPPTADGYSCDNCGAPLSQDADVSPHGDVKCEHCGCWFNIHSR